MEVQKPIHYVMDYETLSNLFLGVFEHYSEDIRHVFVVHELRNDFAAFVDFLRTNANNGQWHISYNGLGFDSQITHYILDNAHWLINLSGEEIARKIYQYAQRVIEKARLKEWSDYPEWKMKIKQIDIFKMNHWDGKSCSLKWIQYSTDWLNMEEMPLYHGYDVNDQEEIDMVIGYCINDVASTKKGFYLSAEQVSLRKSLTNTYGINLYSASEPRISKEIFAHFLAPKMGIDKKELKQMRTRRSHVIVKDIILPYIQFTSPEFQKVHEWYKNMVIDYTVRMTKEERKKKYSLSTVFKGCKTDFGLGGLHGVVPGHHTTKPGYIIMTSDVTSFYPNLAIRNRWAPEHIPAEIFCPQYEWFFDERKKIPKTDPTNYVYKIILNATYGLSSEENSFLYDPRLTMQITVNGQLSLSMLYERLATRIPEAKPLMQNTDGLEMMIPEQYKSLYMDICAEWERETQLQLEHDQYKELIAPDVNNYIAVTTGGKTKEKGRFEWKDQEKKKTNVLHKNKSMLVIPKAIYAYYIDGTLPEIFLKNHKNIFDYCAGTKVIGDWKFEARYRKDGIFHTDKLNKIIRYYVSQEHADAVKIVKINEKDGREQQVVAGQWTQVTCNQVDPNKKFEDYKIDMGYYLAEIYKEINNMKQNVHRENIKQLELFA